MAKVVTTLSVTIVDHDLTVVRKQNKKKSNIIFGKKQVPVLGPELVYLYYHFGCLLYTLS